MGGDARRLKGEPVHAPPRRQDPKPQLLEGRFDELVQCGVLHARGGLAQLAPPDRHSLAALMGLGELPGPQEGPL
jgi:hypothetical protein